MLERLDNKIYVRGGWLMNVWFKFTPTPGQEDWDIIDKTGTVKRRSFFGMIGKLIKVLYFEA